MYVLILTKLGFHTMIGLFLNVDPGRLAVLKYLYTPGTFFRAIISHVNMCFRTVFFVTSSFTQNANKGHSWGILKQTKLN